MKINKKNLPLYIALLVPVLMIAVVAAFIFIPGIGKKPQYNFVYLSGQNVYYYNDTRGQYDIVDGHLVNNPDYSPDQNSNKFLYQPKITNPHFYIYNTQTNQAEEISFEKASLFSLDASNLSSDGYSIERATGGNDFIFDSPYNYNSWFLKGHNRAVKLNLKLVGDEYSNNFRFLGWIK